MNRKIFEVVIVFVLAFVVMVNAVSATAVFLQEKDLQVTSGNSVSVAFPSANKAGNLIVAYVIWSNSGSVSLSDTRANAYVSAIGPTNYSGDRTRAQIFYAKNITGGTNTVKATFSTRITAWGILYIHEYSGVDPISPVDAVVGASGSSSAMNSGYLTTMAAGDLLFAGGESGNTITKAGSGYTARSTSYGNMTEDRIATTAGSYAATATQNGRTWIMQLVAFKSASTTPLPVPTISSFTASPGSITIGQSSTLSWVVSNATSLNIDNGIGIVTGTSKVVTPAVTTVYTLTATNSSGSTTAMTAVVVNADTQAPTIPSNLSAIVVSSSQINLSWNASTDNVSVTGYYVYRNGSQIAVASGTTYQDVGLESVTKYTYTVSAYDAAGNVSGQSSPVSATTLSDSTPSHRTSYSTDFPLTENPISENGNWINGKTVGVDWSDISTTPGLVIGTQSGLGVYDDSTALLTGTWGPDQTVQATVYNAIPGGTGCCQEVELRLRSSLSAYSCTGYEVNFSVNPSYQYAQIVRWNGALGDFTPLDSRGYYAKNGDIIKATISGSTITIYLNGTALYSVNDSTYSTGSPGIGFYLQSETGINSCYGFTSFTVATD